MYIELNKVLNDSHCNGRIKKVIYNESKNQIIFYIELENGVDQKTIEKRIENWINLPCNYQYHFTITKSLFHEEDLLKLLRKEHLFNNTCASLQKNDILIKEQEIILNFSGPCFHDRFVSKKYDIRLKDIIFKTFKRKYSIRCVYKETDLKQHTNTLESIESNFIMEQSQRIVEKPKDNEDKAPFIYGKKIKDEIIKIKDITIENEYPSIEGEIFDINIFPIKDNKYLIKFYIDDDTSALRCVLFLSSDKFNEIGNKFKEGMYLRVKGMWSYDERYEKGYVLMIRSLEGINKYIRPDNSNKKRVELHMYSQMSQVDGLINLEKLMKRLSYWGHDSVGITDKSVVQAYPEFFSLAKKYDIKPLFGMEAYLLENHPRILSNPQYANSFNSFVVFDIETTGLSKFKDNLTEIGAVRIENGRIVDQYSELINPEMHISEFIQNLTGIKNEMVQDKETIDKVLPRFLDFCKGAVLVAHNAEFDIGFLQEKSYLIGAPFKFSYLDTLALARALFPKEKKHTLDRLAQKLRVPLENHHRALDDAKATALIFIKLKDLLTDNKTIINENINKIETLWPKSKNIGYNATLYVQNQIGLKNLYNLVSISSTKYFHRRAGILLNDLQKYREGLIIGSGNPNGELFQKIMNHGSYEEQLQIAKKYDFLEVQPYSVYHNLIAEGKLPNKERYREITKTIYKLGEDLNIPVIATGDVRYLDPKDMEFRNILLEGQLGVRPDISETIPGKYLRNTDEMLKDFEYLGVDIAKEIVIDNSIWLKEQLDDILPIPLEKYPPIIEGSDKELREITYDKAHEIYGVNLPRIVEDRIKKELDSIINNGYAVLYIIARNLVKKSNDDGYLVGSRGSVGSSLVATLTGITEVNPLKAHYICPNKNCKTTIFVDDDYSGSGIDLKDRLCPNCQSKMMKAGHNIPFEVFLGFKGDKEPDIDLNFAGEYQSRCHQYTEELFGEGKVFRAGTIGAIKNNTAFGYIKKYMEKYELTFDRANIARLQRGMVGVKRTSGQHPGGIMIVPHNKDITDFTPVQHPADDKSNGVITTHFTYHSIDKNILKLDLLGHDVPSIIKALQDLTGVDPENIPMDDKETMDIFKGVDSLKFISDDHNMTVGSLGIPEFGTSFVRQMLTDTKPTTFSELVRISGLSHGTNVWLNNAQDLIKEGIIQLKDAICTRDDIMLYLIEKGLDEQEAFVIMERVRKDQFVTDTKHEEYVKHMKENNVPEWYIKSCEKIQYLFPKAHAVAYVLMSYRIAYFKVHHPEAFYCTYFSTKIQDYPGDIISNGLRSIRQKMKEIKELRDEASPKDQSMYQVLEVAEEMYLRGIKAADISLDTSDALNFQFHKKGEIQPPLRALDGVSDAHANEIHSEYMKEPFLSIEDMRKRTCVNKTAIESLKNHGVLNGLQDTNQIGFL